MSLTVPNVTPTPSLMGNAPPELISHIFNFLPACALATAAKVCSQWRKLSENDTLWKSLIQHDFGNQPLQEGVPVKKQYPNFYLLDRIKKGRYSLTTLKGHKKAVTSIFSSGQQLFTTSLSSNSIKTWRQNPKGTFQLKKTKEGHCLHWNGYELLRGYYPSSYLGPAGAIANYRLDSKGKFQKAQILETGSSPISCLHRHDDTIFAGTYNGSLQIWERSLQGKFQKSQPLSNGPSPITRIDSSPTHLFTAREDQTLHVYLRTARGLEHRTTVSNVTSFALEGRQLRVTNNLFLYILEQDTEGFFQLLRERQIREPADNDEIVNCSTQRGSLLFLGCSNGLKVLELKGPGEDREFFFKDTGPISSLQWYGDRLFAGSENGAVLILDFTASDKTVLKELSDRLKTTQWREAMARLNRMSEEILKPVFHQLRQLVPYQQELSEDHVALTSRDGRTCSPEQVAQAIDLYLQ